MSHKLQNTGVSESEEPCVCTVWTGYSFLLSWQWPDGRRRWWSMDVDWAMGEARAEWTTYGPLAWDHCSREQITGILDSTGWFLLSRTMYGPSHLWNTSTRNAAVLADSLWMRSAGQSAPWFKKHVHYTNGPWAKRLHATVWEHPSRSEVKYITW